MFKFQLESAFRNIQPNSSQYVTCPFCGREKKMGVTNRNGEVIYHCFSNSCGKRGKFKTVMSKEDIGYILNKEVIQKKFQLPEYFIRGVTNEASMRLFGRYNLISAYSKGLFQTSYDPRLNRQVFFYTDSDKSIIGATGRALHSSIKPKSHVYLNSVKSPWSIGNYEYAVVVEDIFSAVNCYNAGFNGIALSGTSLPIEFIESFRNYRGLVVALDKDASTDAFEIKKLLDFYCPLVLVLLLENDLKDENVEQVRANIHKVLLK
jgi:ribosomal protein L37AE/L43A